MASLEMVKNNSESLLLFLIGQQPMYGYQIIKELEKRSQGYFVFKEGTLYPALHRLEKLGLITGKWQTEAGGRRRRYYHRKRPPAHGPEEDGVAGLPGGNEPDYPTRSRLAPEQMTNSAGLSQYRHRAPGPGVADEKSIYSD